MFDAKSTVLAVQADSADGGVVDEVPVHEADPQLGENLVGEWKVLFRDHVLQQGGGVIYTSNGALGDANIIYTKELHIRADLVVVEPVDELLELERRGEEHAALHTDQGRGC